MILHQAVVFSFHLVVEMMWIKSYPLHFLGGDDGIRTHDPLLAGQVLSQLSYTPIKWLVVISFLQAVGLLGRPKWTRTTDLVLIRHAL